MKFITLKNVSISVIMPSLHKLTKNLCDQEKNIKIVYSVYFDFGNTLRYLRRVEAGV